MSPIGRPRPGAIRVVITSGKGGVGKTSVTVNVAAWLARLGRRVGVLDADFGLGNVDVMLGMTPARHVGSLLSGDLPLDQVLVDGPHGIRVVPAGSGVRALTALTPVQWARLDETVDAMGADLDFLLIDTGPGIDDHIFRVAGLADEIIVVTSHEPTAIVDAYAMVKLLVTSRPDVRIGLVVNAAPDAAQAELVFRQLAMAVKQFLERGVNYYGFIARDPRVGEAVLDQQPVVVRAPDAPASLCFRRLALRVANMPKPGPGPSRLVVPPASIPVVSVEEFVGMEAPRCA
jgi:flagellar biosynthesis protein FlhG